MQLFRHFGQAIMQAFSEVNLIQHLGLLTENWKVRNWNRLEPEPFGTAEPFGAGPSWPPWAQAYYQNFFQTDLIKLIINAVTVIATVI